jgi:hypothetical protein
LGKEGISGLPILALAADMLPPTHAVSRHAETYRPVDFEGVFAWDDYLRLARHYPAGEDSGGRSRR